MSILAAGGGCSPGTRVVESWKDPGVTGPLRFKKVVVVMVHPDATTRNTAEDELVRQIGADRAVAGGRVLADAERGDPEAVKAKVKGSGADGFVMMSIGGAALRSTASPGAESYAPESFRRDPDRNMWAADALAGPARSERAISIRTDIYSVPDEKLVWSGVSEAFDPRDARSLVGDIAKAVAKRLRAERLIE